MQSIHGRLTIAPGVDVGQVQAHFTALLGYRVTFDVTEDPSLIGGFTAEVGGKLYDASLRTQLTQLEQHLKG